MEVIENNQIKEKVYTETLDNGMKIIIIPKKNTKRNILYGELNSVQLIIIL